MSVQAARLKDEGFRLQVPAAGATAGLISRFVIAPLDVVKIRLQLQPHLASDPLIDKRTDIRDGPVYKGTLSTMRQILRHEGVTGLWKGNVPAELLYVSYAAVQFTTYRSITVLLHRAFGDDKRRFPLATESFIAGAMAGAAGTAATYPLDLLRTRFAAQGTERVYSSLRMAIVQIAQEEGVSGFFRGLSPALGQIIPYMGTFFFAYEVLRMPLSRADVPFGGGDAMAGALASVMAKTGTFPLDLVRKRIQVQGPTRARYVHKNIPEYSGGAVRVIKMILAQEGLRGLYRGLTVSLFKAAPTSAITMWTYERALRLYGRLGKSMERCL